MLFCFFLSITGVTAQMLEEVTIDLKQVQEKISDILPNDAILCGQSLNNDLHSLRVKQINYAKVVPSDLLFR